MGEIHTCVKGKQALAEIEIYCHASHNAFLMITGNPARDKIKLNARIITLFEALGVILSWKIIIISINKIKSADIITVF